MTSMKIPARQETTGVQPKLTTPHPGWKQPAPQVFQAVRDALALFHGEPLRGVAAKTESPLLDVGCDTYHMGVLDSLNTTDITSQRAYNSLKKAFPNWSQVLASAPGPVADAIRAGGLAEIKTRRIQDILHTLLEQRGECSLEYLRELSTEEIKAELSRFKGVGPKTIACVLMFCLRHHEFPVDTHVWEMSKQLGWVPAKATRNQTYEHLNALVPDDIKYDLHVLMVRHGKVCPACAKSPRAGHKAGVACPLALFKGHNSPAVMLTAVPSKEAAACGAADDVKPSSSGIQVKLKGHDDKASISKVESDVAAADLIPLLKATTGCTSSTKGVKKEEEVEAGSSTMNAVLTTKRGVKRKMVIDDGANAAGQQIQDAPGPVRNTTVEDGQEHESIVQEPGTAKPETEPIATAAAVGTQVKHEPEVGIPASAAVATVDEPSMVPDFKVGNKASGHRHAGRIRVTGAAANGGADGEPVEWLGGMNERAKGGEAALDCPTKRQSLRLRHV